MAAAAVLGLLAALMFASGWVSGAVPHAGEVAGDRSISAIGVSEPMATVDAYRRGDAPRRPQQMPAAVAVAALLVAVALPGLSRLVSGPLGAVVRRRHPTGHGRGPPHLSFPDMPASRDPSPGCLVSVVP